MYGEGHLFQSIYLAAFLSFFFPVLQSNSNLGLLIKNI